jgi:hypothetical protein
MGILLEILGLLITFMIAAKALKQAGIDIGWLNPFTFFHRRAWRNKVSVAPLYCLDHPVDVAAAMGMAVVQHTGATTAEQKQGLIALYSQHLSASADEAQKLWIASSHLLGKKLVEANEVADIFARTADKFSGYHKDTLLALLRDAAALDANTPPGQQRLIEATHQFFAKRQPDPQSWKTP